MLLLYPDTRPDNTYCGFVFTFHYASTLSKQSLEKSTDDYNLHSIMLLLYQESKIRYRIIKFNLHSIMLLLYRSPSQNIIPLYTLFTFHYASTLSLHKGSPSVLHSQFTFHYASTLSQHMPFQYHLHLHLHSIMLLLYQVSGPAAGPNISYLHSIMLLLYRKRPSGRFSVQTVFTFHYASTLSGVDGQ